MSTFKNIEELLEDPAKAEEVYRHYQDRFDSYDDKSGHPQDKFGLWRATQHYYYVWQKALEASEA